MTGELADMRLTEAIARTARLEPERIATIFGARRQSWAALFERVVRLAAGLAQQGLAKGDRVYALGANSDYYIEYYYAVLWAGGVPVPGNVRWAAAEHAYAIGDCAPRLCLAEPAFVAMAAALTEHAGITLIVMDDAVRPDAVTTGALIAANAAIADRCGEDHDLAVIMYTGGTTGRPKGVMLSHYSILQSFVCGNLVRQLPPNAVCLHSAPFFHVAGCSLLLGITLLGGTHIVLPQFTPAALIETVTKERAEVVLLVPTMFAQLAEHMEKHPADLSPVVRVGYGAAGITTALLRKAMALFPAADFAQGYGQTELSSSISTLEPRFHDRSGRYDDKLRSAGRPLPLVDVKICDEALKEVAPGAVGEIVVRCPGRMLGYWNLPDLTAQTIIDGWVRTGDAGYFDADGFLYIVDRIKDMIITGGENVFSAEVENALAAHPAILECAVIGLPDEKWGERVHAVVRTREGVPVDETALIAHCREQIASYKCPRSFTFSNTPLPLSGAGKILKTELRRRAAGA